MDSAAHNAHDSAPLLAGIQPSPVPQSAKPREEHANALPVFEVEETELPPFLESHLPIPNAPPDPLPPVRLALPALDPAYAPARSIARRVPKFRNFRAETRGAVWTVDAAARWSIRSQQKCLRALAQAHVKATLVERELTTPAPTLVMLEGPIEGVSFRPAQLDRAIEVSCELAVRLPVLARILKAHGVRSVAVNSSYREEPKVSFHTFGLALDMAAFKTDHQILVVGKHFEQTPEALTCEGKPVGKEARVLLQIACDIAESHVFSSVLTPNYNAGHRDHFHIDIRPDDPRLFVR